MGPCSSPFLCRVGFHTGGISATSLGLGQPEGARRTPRHTPWLWEPWSKHPICPMPVTEMSQATVRRRWAGSPLIRACSSCLGESAMVTHTKQRKGIYSQRCLTSRRLQQAAPGRRFVEATLLCRGRRWDRGAPWVGFTLPALGYLYFISLNPGRRSRNT